MHAQQLTEFSIYVDDRPGVLAGVLEAVGASGIDLDAMCVTTGEARGVIRLLGRPADGLRLSLEALVETGLGPLTEAPVLAVDIDRRPNAFRDISAAFAGRGINVLYAYLVPGAGDVPSRCVLRVEDPAPALEAIAGLA